MEVEIGPDTITLRFDDLVEFRQSLVEMQKLMEFCEGQEEKGLETGRISVELKREVTGE